MSDIQGLYDHCIKQIEIGAVCILIVLLCLGCNAKNAEYKKWNADGDLIEQVRYGQVNAFYWFALKDGAIHYEPDYFAITAGQIQERPDPNSIKEASGLISNKIMEVVK